jgi:hypothetical protein
MSEYRVCMVAIGAQGAAKIVKSMNFDNKEDADHYAKNQSVLDAKHSFDIQENDKGEFNTLKSYVSGEEV